MVKGRPLTAIIPARGGSKGLPGKNLLVLGGEPLVARAARLARRCASVDRVVVSSDDPAILAAVEGIDGVIATVRPAPLASDTAKTVDVVLHLLDEGAVAEGFLLLLQPTSPLRTLADLDALLRGFEQAQAPAMVSVVEHAEPRPEKLQRIMDGRLEPYSGTGYEGPRQALPTPYALNGAYYLIDSQVLRAGRSFLPPGTLAFVMAPERSVNLDGPQDWQVLQAMLAAGYWTLDG